MYSYRFYRDFIDEYDSTCLAIQYSHIGEMEQLCELSKSANSALSTFAGTIVYTNEFDSDGVEGGLLDLGKVYDISEVSLNGKMLGSRWYGEHKYRVKNVLFKGKNTIEIKVTTLLLNYVKSLEDNATAIRWTRNQNSVKAGLLGPVRIH